MAHFQLVIQSLPALINTWFVINRRLIGWKLQELVHWLAVPPISALDSDVTNCVGRKKAVGKSKIQGEGKEYLSSNDL